MSKKVVVIDAYYASTYDEIMSLADALSRSERFDVVIFAEPASKDDETFFSKLFSRELPLINKLVLIPQDAAITDEAVKVLQSADLMIGEFPTATDDEGRFSWEGLELMPRECRI